VLIMPCMPKLLYAFITSFAFLSCGSNAGQTAIDHKAILPPVSDKKFDTSINSIHVFVALCDNKYQGIVPVPAKIGNGEDPDNNLYWGCAFGVRTYFKNSRNWTLIKQSPADNIKLERLVFKHRSKNWYLVADAYNGKYIKDATINFLQSCAGQGKDVLAVNGQTIGTGGNAQLIAYIGHDGLMDFQLDELYKKADDKKRNAIMLACKSRPYFAPHLKATGAYPLVWSTGLMSPEAYTLHDAIETYINKGTAEQARIAAAKAYAKYQHCSEKAAMRLLVTGW